jgi:hypothetical protein
MIQLIRRYPLVTFLVLAFGLTWLVWVPRAAGAPLGTVGMAWTWVPAIAALLAAALTGGRAAMRDLGSRLVRWRVGWQWYLVVILGPAVFSLVVAGVYVMLGGSWADAAPPALVQGSLLLLLPIFLGILTLTDGLGEELAWRGFALATAAHPPQRPRCQLDPRRDLGAVAPPPALDGGRGDVPITRLAAPHGLDGKGGPLSPMCLEGVFSEVAESCPPGLLCLSEVRVRAVREKRDEVEEANRRRGRCTPRESRFRWPRQDRCVGTRPRVRPALLGSRGALLRNPGHHLAK